MNCFFVVYVGLGNAAKLVAPTMNLINLRIEP